MATKQELKNKENELKEKIKIELKVFGCQWDLIGGKDPEDIAKDSAMEIIKIIKNLGYRLPSGVDYKLPLKQCETCGAKEHCLKFKPKHCPNEFQEVVKKIEHIKSVYKRGVK